MSLLKTIKSDSSVENEKDSVGGGGVLESGLYPFKIVAAYVIKAASEAVGIVLNFENADKKRLRQTVYITSGKEKGCSNFYEDKKTGEKRYLPGFLMANSLALLTVGKEISDLDTEKRVVPVYNSEAKKEIPTEVDMIMELVGQEVLLGVLKQKVDKTTKDGAGKYVPTGETREENEIDKIFRASDRMTTAEIRGNAETAVFADTWSTKWAGVTKDKTSKVAGTPGMPKAAGGTQKPATSLFGPKA